MLSSSDLQRCQNKKYNYSKLIRGFKSKCEPWINDEKITSIKVMKVEDVGYFKLSKEFEEILKDQML